MNHELQKIVAHHLETSDGRFPVSEEEAARELQKSGAANADEYIRQRNARIAATVAEFESLPKIPRGHRLADNNSFGGWLPQGSFDK